MVDGLPDDPREVLGQLDQGIPDLYGERYRGWRSSGLLTTHPGPSRGSDKSER